MTWKTLARTVLVAFALISASSRLSGEYKSFDALGISLGDIPDSDITSPGCQNDSTTRLDVQFLVSETSGTLLDVIVDFNASHTWVQDLEVTLIAPGGIRSHLIFSATGTTSATPNNCGDTASWGANKDLSSASTYTFTDKATTDWWTMVKNVSSPLPSLAARTVVSGIGGITSPPPATTSLSAAFRGMTAAQMNGIWTLRFRDRGNISTGSVTAAKLALITTGVAASPATLGSIPDSDVESPNCQNNSTTFRDVEFQVSGLSGLLQSLAVDFSASHPHLQDLEVTLLSPGGSRSHLLFSATGTTSSAANSCSGSSSDLSSSNSYLFADSATANWWTTASTNIVVPTSTNRTVVSGIGGTTNPPATTSLDASFAGLNVSGVNGTWKLRFRDRGFGDTGSVTAAHLSLVMSVFADGFDADGLCTWSNFEDSQQCD